MHNHQIHQGGKTKYEGVSNMSEKSMLEGVKNCLMQRPKVRIKQLDIFVFKHGHVRDV